MLNIVITYLSISEKLQVLLFYNKQECQKLTSGTLLG
jgi:hypothetical protein